MRFSSMLLIVVTMLVVQSLHVTAQPFAELNNTSMQNAVALWTSSDLVVRTQAGERHDNVTHWDVSKITQMTHLFNEKRTFNADLSGWDVRKNENMASMFLGAKLFDGTLGRWDASKVWNMASMFRSASMFNSDASLWCVQACVCVMRVRMRVRVTWCVCAWCVMPWCVVRGACACACAGAGASAGAWCVVRGARACLHGCLTAWLQHLI